MHRCHAVEYLMTWSEKSLNYFTSLMHYRQSQVEPQSVQR